MGNYNGSEKLEKLEIQAIIETIKIAVLPKAVRILKKMLEYWGDLLSFDL